MGSVGIQTAAAFNNVVTAIRTLNLIDLVNAIIDIPAYIAGGLLNGAPFGDFEQRPGILSPLSSGELQEDGRVYPYSGVVASLIALDRAIGAAITSLFHPAPAPLASVNELPTPGALMLTLATTPVMNSGSTPGLAGNQSGTTTQAQQRPDRAPVGPASATKDPTTTGADDPTTTATDDPTTTGADTSNQVPPGLDTSVAGSANGTDGLAQPGSNASTEGQHGLGAARSAINASADIRDGNKAQSGQLADESGAPPSGPAVKAEKPNQADSTPSRAGDETKKDSDTSN